jgi:hypothetical protein
MIATVLSASILVVGCETGGGDEYFCAERCELDMTLCCDDSIHDEICASECERWATCYGDDQSACEEGCLTEFASYGSTCNAVQVELKQCVAALDCEELAAYWDADPSEYVDYPCDAEYNRVLSRCY